MLKRGMITITVSLLLQTTITFAGIEWQSKTVTNARGKESTILQHVYAQNAMVREEFVDVKGENPLMAKGMYWLYKGDSNTIYIVNPKEKSYFAVNIDSLLEFAGSMSQVMQMTVSNVKVEVKQLNPETVATYLCKHIVISSSYDIEMKIVAMKVKNHVMSVHEIWATDAISLQDLAGTFQKKAFKTVIKGIDDLVKLQMASYKDLGFTIKSITTQTISSGSKTETQTTEMNVTNISSNDLNNDLFTIPADYKETKFGLELPGSVSHSLFQFIRTQLFPQLSY